MTHDANPATLSPMGAPRRPLGRLNASNATRGGNLRDSAAVVGR